MLLFPSAIFLGFIFAFICWYDLSLSHLAPPKDYWEVADLVPRHKLGEPTLDVLLELYEMRDTIKLQWEGRPPNVKTLLPLLFQFCGYSWVDFVTSNGQLYRRVLHLKCELKNLSPGDRETLLHSVCFERPTVKRRTTFSTSFAILPDGTRIDRKAEAAERRRALQAADFAASLQAQVMIHADIIVTMMLIILMMMINIMHRRVLRIILVRS
jgi:hypothetical protein